MPDPTLPRIDLFCTTGGASKEYHLFTERGEDGSYTLYYANGKIGEAMKPKVKAGPGTLEAITKVFDKTVKEKKGANPPYTESATGVAYSMGQSAGDISGWSPQLLTEVTPEGLEALLSDDSFVLEEKHNGERRGVSIADGEVRGMNKKGRYLGGLPTAWVEALQSAPGPTLLDGEHVGDVFHVFDATMVAGEDLTGRPLEYRKAILGSFLSEVFEPSIRQVQSHRGRAAKEAALAEIEARMGEGGVFKRLSGTYTAGSAPNVRSADYIKYKFYESSTCIVREKNAGRSVGLDLLDEQGKPVDVGNVTIPANHAVPEPGALVEVRYMHMFEGGKLYGPPVYLGPRSDVDRDECTLAQVKRIKARGASDAFDEEDDAADAAGAQRPRARA